MKSILIGLLALMLIVPSLATSQTIIYHPQPNFRSGYIYTPLPTNGYTIPPMDWQAWRPYYEITQPTGPQPFIQFSPSGSMRTGVTMDAWTVIMGDSE